MALAIADDVHEDVDPECDVTRDRGRAKFRGPREQQRQSIDGARRRAGVDRGKRTLMSRAERLEQRRGLAGRAHLADKNAVRAHPQGVRDEVSDPDA